MDGRSYDPAPRRTYSIINHVGEKFSTVLGKSHGHLGNAGDLKRCLAGRLPVSGDVLMLRIRDWLGTVWKEQTMRDGRSYVVKWTVESVLLIGGFNYCTHRRNQYLGSSGGRGRFAAYPRKSVKPLNRGPLRWPRSRSK